MKMTLLEETLQVLKRHKKSPFDVKWCGSETFGWFTWDEFTSVADKDYGFSGLLDDAYPKVATDLVIVGDNWWLERYTCHENEWWEFKTLPKKPEKHRYPLAVINVATNSGETLMGIHNIVKRVLQSIK